MEKENIYAKRIDQVQMSSIRVVMEKVEKLKSQGKSAVSLCAGEPDFNTPEGIKKATIEALNNNQTHYSSNRGYLGLRQKVAQLLKEQTTVDYDSDQEIIMTCGCSEAINNACLAFIEPGDEVIIFTPAFVSYQNTVLLCEGIPVEIPLKASNEFQIDIEELKSKITNKTKMMIINNPSNPTGAVYQKETLEKVCQLARENNILILADEIYNQLDYEKQYVSIASFENMKDYTIIVNGFSKAYAMTGWRMGYIASSQENIEPILKVHQYTTTSQMTFAQIGMAKAIDQEDVKEEVQHMVDTFHERRTFIMEQLDQCESLSYIKPHGAFYIMVDVSKTGLNGQEFADKLLDYGVAVVPASGFGKDFIDFVRISFASSKENIEEAFVRIKKLLSDVKKAQD
jgi:aspartate/tyrosine/aromatic aminotransferase